MSTQLLPRLPRWSRRVWTSGWGPPGTWWWGRASASISATRSPGHSQDGMMWMIMMTFFRIFYMFFAGNLGVCAWKCSSYWERMNYDGAKQCEIIYFGHFDNFCVLIFHTNAASLLCKLRILLQVSRCVDNHRLTAGMSPPCLLINSSTCAAGNMAWQSLIATANNK